MSTNTSTGSPVLELFRCASCHTLHSYPRAGCAKCGGETHRVPASGRGTLYSYTVVHRAPSPELKGQLPYVIGIVKTLEGPHLMARVEGIAPEAVAIGMNLVLTPPQHPERGYLAFRPA